MALQVGQLIDHDRYLIETHLGQGGMGSVYLAWDRNLEIKVAIKENLTTSPEARKQFLKEAQILARLSHPNLPRVTDYFSLPDQGQYLVMDFVEGEDLHSLLKRNGKLSPEQVLPWMQQIGDALAYLHSQPSPIVHRDVKPGNIKIRPDGRALLVDFGIAKVYDPDGYTTGGARAFTPGYSPPEQYGEGTTDPRSDIYALGATIYHLLTGISPPDGVRRMLKQENLIPPGQLNPAIHPLLEKALLKAMELEPEMRFQSMSDFNQTLLALPSEFPATTDRSLENGKQARASNVEASPYSEDQPTEPMDMAETPEVTQGQPRRTPRRAKSMLPVWITAVAFVLVCGLLSYATYARLAAFGGQAAPATPTWVSQRVTPGGGVILAANPTKAHPMEKPSPTAPAPSNTPPPATALPTETLSPAPIQASGPSFTYQVIAQISPSGKKMPVRGVAAKDGYVYVLNAGGQIQTFDLTSLSPDQSATEFRQPVASLQVKNSTGLLLHSDFLYAYGKNGLDVIDISNPAAPELIDAVDGPSANNLIFDGNRLIAPGDGQISLYDFTLLGSPNLSAFFTIDKNQQFYGAAVLQDRLYVTGRRNNPQDPPFLHVLDYSDPGDLREIRAIPLSALALHILPEDRRLVLCSASQVQLWNLNEPDHPTQIASAENSDGRACLLDSGIVLTGSDALWLAPNGLQSFSTYAERSANPEDAPLNAVMMDEFAIIARPDRVLVLAAVSN